MSFRVEISSKRPIERGQFEAKLYAIFQKNSVRYDEIVSKDLIPTSLGSHHLYEKVVIIITASAFEKLHKVLSDPNKLDEFEMKDYLHREEDDDGYDIVSMSTSSFAHSDSILAMSVVSDPSNSSDDKLENSENTQAVASVDKPINIESKDNENELKDEKFEQSEKIEEKIATQELTLPKVVESQDIIENEEKTLDVGVDNDELISKVNKPDDLEVETQINPLDANNNNDEFVNNDKSLDIVGSKDTEKENHEKLEQPENLEEKEETTKIEEKPIQEPVIEEPQNTVENDEKTLHFAHENVKDDVGVNNDEQLIKEHDLRLEISSRESLNSQELDRLGLIIANRKKHGGGDYDEFIVSPSSRLIRVRFKYVDDKKRLLQKKYMAPFDSNEKIVFLNENFDETELEVDLHVIIIQARVSQDFVKMYAENLVNYDSDNEIDSIKPSDEIPHVFYVRYKKPIDQSQIQERMRRRPTISNCPVNIVTAYKTNAVIINLDYNLSKNVIEKRDEVEMIFASIKRCGVSSFEKLILRDPYLIVVYSNEEQRETVAKRDYSIEGHAIKVERLYNYSIFESFFMQPRIDSNTPCLGLSLDDEPKLKYLKNPILNSLNNKWKYEFSDENPSKLRILCTIPMPDTEYQYQIAKKNWKSSFRTALNTFLRTAEIYTTEPFDAYTMNKIMSSLSYNQQHCYLSKIEEGSNYRLEIIVTKKTEIDSIRSQIETIRSQVEKERAATAERKITRSYRGLLKEHFNILKVNRFVYEVKSKFDCEVELIIEKHRTEESTKLDYRIKFTGVREKIDEAENLKNEMIKSIVSEKIPVNPMMIELVRKNNRFVEKFMLKKGCPCVIKSFDETSLEILTIRFESFNQIWQLIKNEFEERTIDSNTARRQLDATKFSELMSRLKVDQEVVFEELDSTQLRIFGLKSKLKSIYVMFDCKTPLKTTT